MASGRFAHMRKRIAAISNVATLAQPGEDSTPESGVMAFITGQCGPPNCTGSCVLPQENACNDVDYGFTTLLSPVFDLSYATRAFVSYWRWWGQDGFTEDDGEIIVDVDNPVVGAVTILNATLVHTDTVKAYVGENAVVDTAGSDGLTVAADSSEDIIAIGAAGGAAGTAAVVPSSDSIWTTLSGYHRQETELRQIIEHEMPEIATEPGENALLARARDNGVFGTKMRSVIKSANAAGIAANCRIGISIITVTPAPNANDLKRRALRRLRWSDPLSMWLAIG